MINGKSAVFHTAGLVHLKRRGFVPDTNGRITVEIQTFTVSPIDSLGVA